MSILAATDFSENAQTALHAAAYLAKKRGAELTVAHCLNWQPDRIDDASGNGDMLDEFLAEVHSKLQTHVRETLADAEAPSELDCEVFAGTAAGEIVTAADAEGYELVVLGATGVGRIASLLLGSTPEAVIRRCSVPILVVPPEIEAGGYRHIVAPVDMTACSERSLELAVDVAREHDSRLTILHATPRAAAAGPTPFPPSAPLESASDLEEQARTRLDDFLDDISFDELDPNLRVDSGSPRNAIEEAVRELGADLIVMGTHGKRGAERLFLGSTATKVLRTMPCSVMILRHREDSE